jgi:eukaryotic-like serine/threonine-protein kinase
MASQKLRCPCGHSWERPTPGPVPADLRGICPACTPGLNAGDTVRTDGPATDQPEFKPGDEVAGFEILRPLSRGGMGVVYKARQSGLDRIVALKVVAPERLTGTDSEEFLERFRREARAAALLNHPNVVTVYATDLTGPRPYFAMEFVEGIDLYRLVKKAGPLDYAESCDYVRQTALGLQHAFERGLVHRDIKPHNLMVTPSPLEPITGSGSTRKPTVKILDMGLARLESHDVGIAEGLTVADAFLGTPDFAAPEQAEDSRLVDIRADLYSLGATWFYLLTGEVPFPGASLMQKLRRQLTQATPLVTDHRPDVPPVIVAFVRRLMDKDPAERFQTPAELADAIADYLRDPGATPDWMSGPDDTPLEIKGHDGSITALCLNGDGRRLLTGGDDQTLRIWDVPGLCDLGTVNGNPGPVTAVAMTGKGTWAASCALRLMSSDMVVQLWDLKSGDERRRLKGAKDSLMCLALTPDGRKVVAGARDGMVHVWTLDPPDTPTLSLRGHTGPVTGIAFSPDGVAVISGGLDGALRLWDLEARRKEELLSSGESGAVRAVACSAANGYVALAADRLRLLRSDDGLATLDGHDGPVLCVAFSADGGLLASGGTDGTVRLWRTSDGKELATLRGHEGPVRAIAVSPDRRFAYSGGADGTIRRWPIRVIVGAAPK